MDQNNKEVCLDTSNGNLLISFDGTYHFANPDGSPRGGAYKGIWDDAVKNWGKTPKAIPPEIYDEVAATAETIKLMLKNRQGHRIAEVVFSGSKETDVEEQKEQEEVFENNNQLTQSLSSNSALQQIRAKLIGA